MDDRPAHLACADTPERAAIELTHGLGSDQQQLASEREEVTAAEIFLPLWRHDILGPKLTEHIEVGSHPSGLGENGFQPPFWPRDVPIGDAKGSLDRSPVHGGESESA